MPEEVAERYSDQRLKANFFATVLFDNRLDFTSEEIIAAAQEDFPALDWSYNFVMPGLHSSKPEVLLSPINGNGWIGNVARMPGPFVGTKAYMEDCTAQGIVRSHIIDEDGYKRLLHTSRLVFPEADGAVQRSVEHLDVSAWSTDELPADEDQRLAHRFREARRMTCLSAVFAKLPIATAVYLPSADLLIKPEEWVRAATQALMEEWPFESWIQFDVQKGAVESGPVLNSASTIGMAAFNGHELYLDYCALDAKQAATQVWGAAWLLLAGGNRFKDGDTIGFEEDSLKLRMRHCVEGQFGAQTDRWILFHPEGYRKDTDMFGETESQPPPPGVDNSIRPKESFLSRILGSKRRG
ncbi:MAG: hypothetical protein AAGC81_17430 [Pseudomonadota bacterium]